MELNKAKTLQSKKLMGKTASISLKDSTLAITTLKQGLTLFKSPAAIAGSISRQHRLKESRFEGGGYHTAQNFTQTGGCFDIKGQAMIPSRATFTAFNQAVFPKVRNLVKVVDNGLKRIERPPKDPRD